MANVLRKHVQLRALPPIVGDWKPPQYFPELRDSHIISIDTETKETDWTNGPGWGRGKAVIVGFSVAAIWKDGRRGKWYFPVRHEVEPEHNLDPQQCFAWLKTQLETPHIFKCGANLLYDIGNLTDEGIFPQGEFLDVQFAEALLDEKGETNLEFLGTKYLGRGKTSSTLYEWLASAYGGSPTGDQRGNIWRAPPRLVGPYAEDDADLPIDVLDRQTIQLIDTGVLDLFRMECSAIPMLVRMRRAGVTVDLRKAEEIDNEIAPVIRDKYDAVYSLSGIRIDSAASADQISKVFDALEIPYPRTRSARPQPSFQKTWLKAHAHPVAKLVMDIREMEKLRGTFIRNAILNHHNNGRLHCQFHPLRKSEDGFSRGASTGRYSSSDPNLQQIPSRSKIGKRIREIFVPDYGNFCWEKNDHSQIEYRVLAHYAVGPGADELRASFIRDRTADYHKIVQDNVRALTGLFIERTPIKNINFGLIYGQTEKSLAVTAGFTPEQAKGVFSAYHQGAPYVRPTMQAITREVHENGFIRTVLGRRTHFDMWEPAGFGEKQPGLPLAAALAYYGGNIQRAGAYRGVNYKCQGSAADVMKSGMVAAYYAGVFESIGLPKLQVHDELDFSVIDDTAEIREGHAELRHIMETALQLAIPLRVDHARGDAWGLVE